MDIKEWKPTCRKDLVKPPLHKSADVNDPLIDGEIIMKGQLIWLSDAPNTCVYPQGNSLEQAFILFPVICLYIIPFLSTG